MQKYLKKGEIGFLFEKSVKHLYIKNEKLLKLFFESTYIHFCEIYKIQVKKKKSKLQFTSQKRRKELDPTFGS